MINRRSKRGSILAEALVAITTLVAGVIALGTIINNAVAATGVSKDYLVAQNLLTEGVESTKIIRATNWMRWPQFTQQCWMVIDPTNLALNPGVDGSGCVGKVAVLNADYVAKEVNGKWKLELSGAAVPLNLAGGNVGGQARYRLYIQNAGVAPNNYSKYVHLNALPNVPSKFYRSLKPISVNQSSVLFETKIQWFDGAKVREVKRNFTIYNYQ